MSTFRTVESVLVERSAGRGDRFRNFWDAGRKIELPWPLPNATSHAASFDHLKGRSMTGLVEQSRLITQEDARSVLHVFNVKLVQDSLSRVVMEEWRWGLG